MTISTVLVVTHWFDPTADFVIDELNRRAVPVLRFDAADFPHRLTMAAVLDGDEWDGVLHLGGRSVALGDVGGVYFRRPTVFDFGSLRDPTAEWALAEARNGLGGLLMATEKWLNHPHRIGYADFKPVQLVEARRAGLTVPKTIITNDPQRARTFLDEVDAVIYKPMSPAVLPDGAAEGTMHAVCVLRRPGPPRRRQRCGGDRAYVPGTDQTRACGQADRGR